MNRWDANLYDNKHSFVTELGKDLITVLNPKEKEAILDLGCGTGDLAHQISLAGANVTGIDSSEDMIAKARQKYPHINFRVADARTFSLPEQFDAVFSNAVLHWIKPPEKVLKNIGSSLRSGGRFVAEFGGKGNVASIITAIHKSCSYCGIDLNLGELPWFFPSVGEYASLMESSGFQVTYAMHFDRPTPLEGENGLKSWIHMFGGTMLANVPLEMQDKVINQADTLLREILLHEDVWIADYKRIRIAAIKK